MHKNTAYKHGSLKQNKHQSHKSPFHNQDNVRLNNNLRCVVLLPQYYGQAAAEDWPLEAVHYIICLFAPYIFDSQPVFEFALAHAFYPAIVSKQAQKYAALMLARYMEVNYNLE